MKHQQRNNYFTVQNNIKELKDVKEVSVKRNGVKIISCGVNNLQPQEISNVIASSSTLSNSIYSKSEYVSYGELLTDNNFVIKKLNDDFNKDYDFYEFLKRISLDYYSFGYAVYEVKTIGKEKFIFHVDASKIRFTKNNAVYFSNDWSDRKENVVNIPTAVVISDYLPNTKTYPLPSWKGCYFDAQVESLIGQYNANQFENGITLSSMLLFDFGDAVSTDLEDDETIGEYYLKQTKKLENKIKGTSGGRSGKTLVIPTNEGVEKPEYVVYPMDKEGSYLKLQEMIENNIIKSCNWFRSLSGLATAGTLGNTQQLKNEWIMAERLIQNMQFKITNSVFKTLGFSDRFQFNNQSPVDVSITEIKDILTSNLSNEQKKEVLTLMGIDKSKIDLLVI